MENFNPVLDKLIDRFVKGEMDMKEYVSFIARMENDAELKETVEFRRLLAALPAYRDQKKKVERKQQTSKIKDNNSNADSTKQENNL